MPGFRHTLVGVGSLSNVDCKVTLTREAVIVRDKKGKAVITGWREATWSRLWRIALQPGDSNLPSVPNDANLTTLAAYGAYELTIVSALIIYLHAAAGFLVRSTWLRKIVAGNHSLWPGLTISNATKYCPSTDSTIMRHLVQKRQGVRSTKPNPPPTSSPEEPIPQVRSNELFIQVTPISKFYTNDTGCFLIHASVETSTS